MKIKIISIYIEHLHVYAQHNPVLFYSITKHLRGNIKNPCSKKKTCYLWHKTPKTTQRKTHKQNAEHDRRKKDVHESGNHRNECRLDKHTQHICGAPVSPFPIRDVVGGSTDGTETRMDSGNPVVLTICVRLCCVFRAFLLFTLHLF